MPAPLLIVILIALIPLTTLAIKRWERRQDEKREDEAMVRRLDRGFGRASRTRHLN